MTLMQRIRTQFTAFLAGIFALAVVFGQVSIASASEITPDKVIELVNRDRSAQGFRTLQTDEALTRAAQAKADDMAKSVYFAHTSPSGLTPWHWIQKSGYDYRFAGENLAIHFTDAEEQEKAWMESVKHKENILSPKYQDVGVAVKSTVQNGQATIIVVQMFGLPSGVTLPAQVSGAAVSSEKTTSDVELIPSIQASAPQGLTLVHAAEIPSEKPIGYFEIVKRLAEGLGFAVAALVVGVGLSGLVRNRKVFYYRMFHKDDVFQYRG